MKISNVIKLGIVCITLLSNVTVIAGPAYKNVIYGARVIVGNQVCTQVITSTYSDASMKDQFLLARDISYTACEAWVGPTIGKVGSIGVAGTEGVSGAKGKIVDPNQNFLGKLGLQ